MTVVLRDALERPVPPSDIQEAFARVDPRISIKYVSFPHRDGINIDREEHWAIVVKWREDDSRRKMIQLGTMPEHGDWDVWAYLPLDCEAHEAFSYFERAIRGRVSDKQDVRGIIDRVHLFNKQQTAENLKETTELAEDLIESNVGTMFRNEDKRITKVFINNPPIKK